MRLFVLALVALSLHSQTTVRIRTGGEFSAYRITAATPAGGNGRTTITVIHHPAGESGHTWSNGDSIYIHGVHGCPSINGHAKVANVNQVAGTAELTTLADAPLACNGTFDYSFQSGWAGKTEVLTVNSDFPRIFVPNSGTQRTRVLDPDGPPMVTCTGPPSSAANPGGQTGCGVSPVAVENSVAWQGMLSAYSTFTTPNCDPYQTNTAAGDFCTATNALMGHQMSIEMWSTLVGAFVYANDNSKRDYLNMAKFYALRSERLYMEDSSGRWWPGFGCPIFTQHCGIGSGSEWMGEMLTTAAFAYDFLRPHLTTDERIAYLKKMLWDTSDTCTPSMVQQPYTVNVPAGTESGGNNYVTVTANTPGAFSNLSVGQVIYTKDNVYRTSNGYWGWIESITDTSTMVVRFRDSTVARPNTNIHVVMPYTSNTCGAWYVTGGHGSFDGSIQNRGVARVAASIAAGTAGAIETWPVDTLVNFPLSSTLPEYGGIENEAVEILSYPTSTSVQVRRGVFGSIPAAHTSTANRKLVWMTRLQGEYFSITGPEGITGIWTHNLPNQRAIGYIMSSASALGDLPSATAKFEASYNRWYDLGYTHLADTWAGVSPGALINEGYYWGRWPMMVSHVGLLSRNLFTVNRDILGDWFWPIVDSSYHLTSPGYFNWLPTGPRPEPPYRITSGSGFAGLISGLKPDYPRAAYANYWFKNLSGMGSSGGSTENAKRGPWFSTFIPVDAPAVDFRLPGQADPWWFTTGRSDSLRPDHYLGFMVSRTHWGKDSFFVLSSTGVSDPRDHQADGQGMPWPGDYMVHIGNQVMLGDDTNQGVGIASSSAPLMRPVTALKTISTWWQIGISGGSGSIRSQMDRKHGSADYVFSRANYPESFRTSGQPTTVTAALRTNGHYKAQGTAPDYFVSFDYIETAASGVTTRLENYHTANDAASAATFSANAGCTDMSFKRPTPRNGVTGHVVTKALFPDGVTPTCTVTASAYSQRVLWTFPSAVAARQMNIHRFKAGTDSTVTDTMPPTTLLSADAFSAAAQVDDSNNSRIFVYGRSGVARGVRSFTATAAGQGRAYVHDLLPGNYTVSRDGVAGDSLTVASGDGSAAFNTSGAALYTITLDGGAPLPVEISTTSLPSGTVGVAYSQTIAATNGTAPYTFNLQSGTLPPGLSISSAGLVSGTPTTAGTYSSINVRVTDANPNTDDQVYSITIAAAPVALQITTATLADGERGAAYSQTLAAIGGTAPRTFSVFSGSLPSGLTMSSAGAITGTPTVAGEYPFTARATDAVSATVNKDFTILVAEPPPPTELVIETGSISFTYQQGQAPPPYQTIQLACSFGNCETFTAVEPVDCAWLSTAVFSDTLDIIPSVGGLIPGEYTCTINVSADLATNNPQSIAVTLTVSAPPPTGQSLIINGGVKLKGRIRR